MSTEKKVTIQFNRTQGRKKIMAAKKKATKKEKAKEPEMVVTKETGVSIISLSLIHI